MYLKLLQLNLLIWNDYGLFFSRVSTYFDVQMNKDLHNVLQIIHIFQIYNMRMDIYINIHIYMYIYKEMIFYSL